MTKVKVQSGICGFETNIEAELLKSDQLELKISSKCPSINQISDKVLMVNPLEEVFKKLDQTKIYKLFSEKLPHSSCPLYSAVLKTIEVEANLALPKDAVIEFEKVE